MLKNEFEPYMVIGAGISWNITDWGKTRRAIQLLEYGKQNIDVERNTFLHQLELLRTRQWEEILRLERQLQTDGDMIILRQSITRDAETRMNNGIITAADYLRELNLETIVGINLATRRLQIEEAYNKYLILSGLQKQNKT
jgi:outer membrane protein TolC